MIRILAVGRLDEQKNHRLFLRALAQLRRTSHLPVVGLIAGEGPKRKDLQFLAQQYELLPTGVQFLGNVADPVCLYQQADIFILTSNWEGTPNVVLEAMACGLPVVATAVGGVPDLIENDSNGCLVERGDLKGLNRSLVELIADEEKRMHLGAAARRSVLEKHDLQRLPEILNNFYQIIQ